MTDDTRGEAAGPLAAHLRRLDPASELPPLEATALGRMLTDAMGATDAGERPVADRLAPVADLASRRRRWVGTGLLGVAAAGVVAIGAAVVVGASGVGDDPTTLALQAAPAGGPETACAELTPETLVASDLAVAGEVTAVDGGTVTLTITRTFTGDVADGGTVTVPQGDGDVLDGAQPVFVEGHSYLLAARGGQVSTCGATGDDSPELRAVYDQAFPR